MTNTKVKERLPKTKEDLPWQAFAIVGDKGDPDTWKLPHHNTTIFRAIKGKIGFERTVDWELMPAAVAALSREATGARESRHPRAISFRQPGILPGTIKKRTSPCPILWRCLFRQDCIRQLFQALSR